MRKGRAFWTNNSKYIVTLCVYLAHSCIPSTFLSSESPEKKKLLKFELSEIQFFESYFSRSEWAQESDTIKYPQGNPVCIHIWEPST